MKKRLAMIATMLMVTVSMAACGGKKDTTADKETVINTEATEEVAETVENWRVILPVQRILQHSHLTIIQANQIRATAIPAIRQVQAALHQPEQLAVIPVEQLEAVITPILLTIVQLRHMFIPGCCMKAAVTMRRR